MLSSLGDAPFWMMGVVEPAPLGAAERRAAAAALAEAVQVRRTAFLGGLVFGWLQLGRPLSTWRHYPSGL
jgi:hypothetical protein